MKQFRNPWKPELHSALSSDRFVVPLKLLHVPRLTRRRRKHPAAKLLCYSVALNPRLARISPTASSPATQAAPPSSSPPPERAPSQVHVLQRSARISPRLIPCRAQTATRSGAPVHCLLHPLPPTRQHPRPATISACGSSGGSAPRPQATAPPGSAVPRGPRTVTGTPSGGTTGTGWQASLRGAR